MTIDPKHILVKDIICSQCVGTGTVPVQPTPIIGAMYIMCPQCKGTKRIEVLVKG